VTVPAVGPFVAACSREAALWACTAHHYAGGLPAGRLQNFGCWEDGRFCGAIVFSRGACKDLASRFGFGQTEAVELTRVALAPHRTPTTRFIAVALRQLKAANPGLQAVISFSDPAQSHNGHQHDGTIYRAGNWLFLGMTHSESLLRLDGRLRHPRTITSRFRTRRIDWLRAHVDADAARVPMPPKYRFAYPLTVAACERLRPHVQAHLTRSKEQASMNPVDLGGATPTRPLHLFSEAGAHA
jgi:hypothetical protein